MSLDNQLDVSGSELNHLFKLEMNSNLYRQITTLKTSKQHLHMVTKHSLSVQSDMTQVFTLFKYTITKCHSYQLA